MPRLPRASTSSSQASTPSSERLHGRPPLQLVAYAPKDCKVKKTEVVRKGSKDRSGKECLEVTDKETSLMKAVLSNDASAIKVLAVMDRKGLKKHADTALLYAARAGHSEVMKTLCRYGASLDAKDASGRTPFDYAKQSPQPEEIKLLLEQLQTGSCIASDDIRAIFSGAGSRKPSKEASGSQKHPEAQASQRASSIVVRRGARGSIGNLKSVLTM